MTIDLAPIGRALISVSDKSGLVELGRALAGRRVEIVSTGGMAMALARGGVSVLDVGILIGFPKMMDGRFKMLRLRVHGGLLAIRNDPAHLAAMIAHGIAPIDLLVVNLYPFEDALRRGAPFDEIIENIDIGGPAMIRAAAKTIAMLAMSTWRTRRAPRGAGRARRLDRARLPRGWRERILRARPPTIPQCQMALRDPHEAAPDWRAFGGKLASAALAIARIRPGRRLLLGPEARPGVATALQAQERSSPTTTSPTPTPPTKSSPIRH